MCKDGPMTSAEPRRARRSRTRMSSVQRREQLIGIARTLFAERGFDGTSVEEIADHAEVSKPVIYEHFGGKEGLYAVVVDREMRTLEEAIHAALGVPNQTYKQIIERGTMALLDYIEARPDGFRILSRDSAAGSTSSDFASILNDIAAKVQDMLASPLARRGYNPDLGSIYAQGLVGLVAMAGQRWLDDRTLSKEQLVAQLVNLAWNGLDRKSVV